MTNPKDRDLAEQFLSDLEDRMNWRGYDENCITAVLDLIRQIEARTYERAAEVVGHESPGAMRAAYQELRALAEAAKDGAR